MTFADINIRDPFVLVENGKYYLYGTRGATTWTKAYGVDVEKTLTGFKFIGEKIKENQIATELRVSRTPIREAFKLLENEGLIDYIPNRGCFAKGFTKQDVDDIYAVRAALEMLAFSNVLSQYGGYLRENSPVVITGRLSLREDKEPQIVINYNVDHSFKEWTTGAPADESVLCTVNTAQSALDLVAAGTGVSFLPDTCLRETPGVRFLPIKNWHQALYMCIYYDKWLEPLVWDFVELLVRNIRETAVNPLSG